MKKHVKTFSVFISLCIIGFGLAAYAQMPEAPPAPPPVPVTLTAEELKAPFTGSFFLTPFEIDSIRAARIGTPVATKGARPPEHRVISLAGLFYRAPGKWIVWMNGKKMTPKDLLPEIVDIQVDGTAHVRLKWHDRVLNTVLSIELRPHETYDIASGILLPGSDR
jgi:hypothetical protein